MQVTVGTFNLNNLFSRWNFQGEIDALVDNDTTLDSSIAYEFPAHGEDFRLRTYQGRLVKAKTDLDTARITERILRINMDILCVQEVEDIDTLREFNRDRLNGLYDHAILIEGNDPRLIDLGVLSKFPIGAVTSWQCAVHPTDPTQTVFGRDLLQVEILNPSRTKTLFTVFNNHLKSNFVPFGQDSDAGALSNNQRRSRQADVIASIVKDQMRPDSRYIILGDMNDVPDSPHLDAFVNDAELGVTNALSNPTETRPPKTDDPPAPADGSWTHRFKESGQPARYELYDQVWLSPALTSRLQGSFIDRRSRHGGDGSDHDPAWVVLDV